MRRASVGLRPWASIVLTLSHPLLCYPKANVRTHLVGQSRNLWNVSRRGLGIFTLGGVGSVVAGASSAACPGRNHPDSTFRALLLRQPILRAGTTMPLRLS